MTPDQLNMPAPHRLRMERLRHRLVVLLILILSALLMVSCSKGEDGLPGMAFVAFVWVEDEPDYIEIENEFIPAVFYWNWYYRVDPGLYYLYYEGVHWRGGRGHPYAWEIEYEVWENPGTRGKKYWQNGEDGPDAYFTIEMTPFGPEVFYEEFYPEKSSAPDPDSKVVINNGDEILVEKHRNNYSIRIWYRKSEPGRSGS